MRWDIQLHIGTCAEMQLQIRVRIQDPDLYRITLRKQKPFILFFDLCHTAAGRCNAFFDTQQTGADHTVINFAGILTQTDHSPDAGAELRKLALLEIGLNIPV